MSTWNDPGRDPARAGEPWPEPRGDGLADGGNLVDSPGVRRGEVPSGATHDLYGSNDVHGTTHVGHRQAPAVGEERDLGTIVSDLTSDFSTLMRQEVALAKAEVRSTAKNAGKGAGLLGASAFVAQATLTALTLTLWWALGVLIGTADRPSLGWSGLIVTVLWAIVAALLAAAGRSQLREAKGLPRTAETVSKIPQALKGEEENR